MYVEHHSVCPIVHSSELGLPQPLSRKRMFPPPPGPKGGGGGAHSPAVKGVGESQFRRLEKKLNTLPTQVGDNVKRDKS